MVKSSGGQRESDGVVVPLIGVRNAPGGKGPDFGHASGAGKRKGMAGTARSNHPGGVSPIDNVRKLQRKLWAAAKQSEGRRFHALFDRVCRDDVLQLHPGKTKIVDLREGREGFDFLGCHFRARMSGRLWEQQRIRRCYLHRWPSQKAMKRLREKIHDRTDRRYAGTDIRAVISALNPILRGWGNYFRTGNAADKFRQIDDHVVKRLRRLMIVKRGRNLRHGQVLIWNEDWFNGHGLYRLRGTIRYPKAA